MARKAKKTSENIEAQVSNSVAVQTSKPTTPKLIMAIRKFDRWYVYFQGVSPKDNVGCGCMTAKSAIRYMYLLKNRYGATISQNMFDKLQLEAAKEA